MSIWGSWQSIGTDSFTRKSEGRGRVLAYPKGWSNAYPLTVDDATASVGVAHIPSWCVPGRRDEPVPLPDRESDPRWQR